MLSKFFIDRPVFSWVISITILLMGGLAAVTLPIARYPEIAPPTINVSASYPGASAATVAETVATPIEQQVNGVEGMLYMTSSSSSDGTMSLTVTFEVGTDIDMASVMVQNRVALAEARLPEEVRRLGISVKKQSAEITMLVSLFSPDGRYSDVFLSDYAALRIRDELARVPGVGEVTVFGTEYSMRIWLDPDKMRVRQLSVADVLQSIREQNVQVAAGEIGAPPAPLDQPVQLSVLASGRLSEPQQFEEIVLRSDRDTGIIHLSDVARVELGGQQFNLTSQLNTQAASAIAIYQLPGANAIDVADSVQEKLKQLELDFPEAMQATVVLDTTDVIRASIREVLITLFLTLGLVMLTVFVFLQDWRATLIPAATIPVSLVGTFIVLAALGYTLNTITLFGLVLVIGIVVDDAIVVVENTSRLINDGLPRREAAIKSMQEVTGPVVATTLVLLAVFVPTIFLGGIIGRLFEQFAVTISVATVFSSINALTLSPMLCAALLRQKHKKPLLPFRMFDRALEASRSAYVWSARLILRGAVPALLLFGVLATVAVLGFIRLPGGFVPPEDEGYFIVSVQLPDAAALHRSQLVAERVTQLCLDQEGVADVVAITGLSLLDNSRTANAATLFVTLDNWDERPDAHVTMIVNKLTGPMSAIQDAIVMPIIPPSLPGVGNSGGFSMQVQDRAGVGQEQLAVATQQLTQSLNSQKAVNRAFSTYRAGVPQLQLEIDREQAKSMGIPLDRVYEALQAFLGSVYVNDFLRFGRINQVKVQAEATARSTPDDLLKIQVRNSNGDMVPLGAFVRIEETVGPATVTHHNLYASALINGSSAAGFGSGEVLDVAAATATQSLPESFGFAWTGLSFQELSSGGMGTTFLLSAFIVFLVLAAQYGSWTTPLGVIAAIPAALLGAVLGITLLGLSRDAYVQIGIVLLIGLSAKTAILIVEYASQLRREGQSIHDAALQAARLRYRAVLMTAFTFILGVLPLVAASGAGASSRKILGITVFSGMLVGTVVGLLIVPMLFFVVSTVVEKVTSRSRA